MAKRKKQKPKPKLNWRLKDKLISAIFKGQQLFIKDTGVAVTVEQFGHDKFYDRKNGDTCEISFDSTPTGKSLRLVNSYNIHKNLHTKSINSSANIDLYNLSLSPFETSSARLLYVKT